MDWPLDGLRVYDLGYLVVGLGLIANSYEARNVVCERNAMVPRTGSELSW